MRKGESLADSWKFHFRIENDQVTGCALAAAHNIDWIMKMAGPIFPVANARLDISNQMVSASQAASGAQTRKERNWVLMYVTHRSERFACYDRVSKKTDGHREREGRSDVSSRESGKREREIALRSFDSALYILPSSVFLRGPKQHRWTALVHNTAARTPFICISWSCATDDKLAPKSPWRCTLLALYLKCLGARVKTSVLIELHLSPDTRRNGENKIH